MLRPRRLLLLLLLLSAAGDMAISAERPDSARRSDHSSSAVQNAEPPRVITIPTELVVRVDANRALGSASAKVAIVEFGDYQCPYCRAFHVGTLPQLQTAYIDTGKVRYFYKDFPLSIHEHAFGASVAAYCAGAQGRYWQMQELLYAEQARLGVELYGELAGELKLDPERFQACRKSAAARGAVRRDVGEGRDLGINATPSFILGYIEQDRVVVKRTAAGAPSFEVFAKEIEALNR